MPSIIDAAERDTEVAEFQSRTHAGMMSGFGAIAALGPSARRAGPEFRCIRSYGRDRRAALLSPVVFAAGA